MASEGNFRNRVYLNAEISIKENNVRFEKVCDGPKIETFKILPSRVNSERVNAFHGHSKNAYNELA